MIMGNNVKINIVLSLADKKIAEEIVGKAKNDILVWQDLVKTYRNRGVSTYKLRRIILALLSKGKIIELRCRLFTTKEYLERTPTDVLTNKIKEIVLKSGLKKCGKPIGIPYGKIIVAITKSKEVKVYIS